MTDLEDAWNRYPVGAAPDLTPTRRSRFVKPGVGLLAAGIAAGLVVTLNLGGGAGTSGSPAIAAPPMKVVAFQADLKPAASCDALLKVYRDRGAKTVTAWGWNGGVYPAGAGYLQRSSGAVAELDTAVKAPSAMGRDLQAQTNSTTGTNVQEVGVDEPDLVKTNGSLLARLDGNTLAVYDLTGTEPKQVSTLALPYFDGGQILMSGTTITAIGYNTTPGAGPMSARVVTVSLAKASAPTITANTTYTGSVTSARQHGNDIRLVLATSLPALAFVQPDKTRTEKQALEANRAVVAKSTLAQWLPDVDDGSGRKQLVDCTNVAVTPDTVPLGTTSVVGFSATAPTTRAAIGLSGQVSDAYESADHLFLISNGTNMGWCSCPVDMAWVRGGVNQNRTAIFQFDLTGYQAEHVATGTVGGQIQNRYSMDEVNGVLRVASTTYATTSQSTSVITLQQSKASLKAIGRVDNLGVGETMTAARWFDDFAVLSTAKQIDPLYTVDLTKPTQPTVLGALHIPGFSNYFHPIGNGQLLGVGQSVSFDKSGEQQQAQVALFNIANLKDVKQLAVSSLSNWTYPLVQSDTHAFAWLPDRKTALTFFSSNNGGVQLGEFTVQGSKLMSKVTDLNTTDASKVRTFELPNGKVVLLAGGTVKFLTL